MFILQNKKIMASKIHVDTFMQFSHMILSSLLLDSSKKKTRCLVWIAKHRVQSQCVIHV